MTLFEVSVFAFIAGMLLDSKGGHAGSVTALYEISTSVLSLLVACTV